MSRDLDQTLILERHRALMEDPDHLDLSGVPKGWLGVVDHALAAVATAARAQGLVQPPVRRVFMNHGLVVILVKDGHPLLQRVADEACLQVQEVCSTCGLPGVTRLTQARGYVTQCDTHRQWK